MSCHIAAVMMLRNEETRLHVTLASIIGTVQSLVVYDTGSTDNTLSILRTFCATQCIPLHLMEGTFVDFSTSRNLLLDFADSFEEIAYLLLLDCNDELRGAQQLVQFVQQQQHEPEHCWLMCQQWYAGETLRYYNTRLLKPRHGWRYKGVVHEFLYNPVHPELCVSARVPEEVCLFQNRVLDDDKSAKRFIRDYALLFEAHKADPKEGRTLFYLAQTCACLNKDEEAFKYYELRAKIEEGFVEERFEALLKSGDLAKKYAAVNTTEIPSKKLWYAGLRWEHAIVRYMQALTVFPRIEPLIAMTTYYLDKKVWHLAYMCAHSACAQPYPAHSVLFVNKQQYEYERWHLMGIVAYYVEQHVEGYEACQKAIAVKNAPIDTHNLGFYQRALTTKDSLVQKLEIT